MTTAIAPSTMIKFTGLSPLTTQLIRVRTALQQQQGILTVGRTVLTYRGEAEDLDLLLDYLIASECSGSGPSSKEVRRLREVRRMLRAAVYADRYHPEDQAQLASHVTITTGPVTTDRERILDLLDVLWERHADHPAAQELADMADAAHGKGDGCADYRAWLSEVLG